MEQKEQPMQRQIEHVVNAHQQKEGGGFLVRRPLPNHQLELLDPFLLIDEFGPVTYAPGKAIGAPDHPHRGFETVTYLLQGEGEHKDSSGHQGILMPGDVQWMTAGAGVVHSEMPSRRLMEEGGPVHGFQIWVNLPARLKMSPPRYQEIPQKRIPMVTSPDGLIHVKVIAGEALGAKSVIDTHTPIMCQDWTLKPGADIALEINPDHNGGIYVFSGSVLMGSGLQQVEEGQLAVLGKGSFVQVKVPSSQRLEARFLLLAGVPIGEPVARYGPFVMNTQEELQQAFRDYQNGQIGRIH